MMKLTTTNMHAYELLPRLKYLTLVGQDDEYNLEFIGTTGEWNQVYKLEHKLLNL